MNSASLVRAGVLAGVLGLGIWAEFGAVTALLLAFYLILSNTSDGGQGAQLSAYSVFNKNCESIRGSIDVEQMEREMRSGGQYQSTSQDGPSGDDEEVPTKHIETTSTARSAKVRRNDRCVCGSGKKFKKCCGKNSDEWMYESD